MTFGSLFTGIGGIDLGLEAAGMVGRWQVEVDPYGRQQLERHWPDIPKRGDIRLCDASVLAPVDLVAGGFPCQDISCAGKGEGITGKRSGLWRDMLRLVQGLRPRWVLAENVGALRTRGADAVLGDLEAAGYACWPLVVGAWAVGAPHRRERVWIVARLVDADDAGRGERRGAEPARAEIAAAQRASELADADADGAGLYRLGRGGLLDRERPASRNDVDGRHRWPARPGEPQHAWEAPRTAKPRVGRAAHGVSRRLALKALGNSACPAVVELIGRAILAADA